MENVCSSDVGGRLDGLSGSALLEVARAAVARFVAEGGDGAALAEVVGGLVRSAAGETLGGGVDDEGLVGSIVAWQRVERGAHGVVLRRVREVCELRAWVGRATSPVGLLADRLGVSRAEARTLVDAAEALARMPSLAAGLADGRLGASHVMDVARSVKGLERLQALDEAEVGDGGHADGDRAGAVEDGRRRLGVAVEALDTAVGQVARGGDGPVGAGTALEGAGGGEDDLAGRGGGVVDRGVLRRVVAAWEHDAAQELVAERERRVRARRSVWVGRQAGDVDGMGGLRGDLAPVTTAKARTVLSALARKTHAEDPRSFGQRCHDAFDRLLDLALASGEVPDVAGDQPRVLLIVEADALHDVPGATPARLDGYGEVSNPTARQLCCDAEVTVVVRGEGSRVLNVGRDRRQPNRAQRRGVFARDGGCVGCGGPLSQCQIHHVDWWSKGGRTDIDRLVAVCWDCHALIHHCGWQVVRRRDGRYGVRRPDGLNRPPSPETSRGGSPDAASRRPTPQEWKRQLDLALAGSGGLWRQPG